MPDIDETLERLRAIEAKQQKLGETFTPSHPVQTREIFSGRVTQLLECTLILKQPGSHGILYGERGVGKTSIANVVRLLCKDGSTISIKIECGSEDTYEDLVERFCERLDVEILDPEFQLGSGRVGFQRDIGPQNKQSNLADVLKEKANFKPSTISNLVSQLDCRIFIILDEFDRLDHSRFKLSPFTELLKSVSDNAKNVHFLIVGVGDDVQSIIGNHESIKRNLNQIHLQVMGASELREIIEKGLAGLGMSMTDGQINQITEISCGYPHYTHMLAYHACYNAISQARAVVEEADVSYAITKSVESAHEIIRRSYQQATMATKQNIYKEVLLACGMTPLDEYNTFQPKDVAVYLSAIMKSEMKVTQFGSHLRKLCSDERGNILVSKGQKGRARYQFKDPLMRAFVKLNSARARPSGSYK